MGGPHVRAPNLDLLRDKLSFARRLRRAAMTAPHVMGYRSIEI
jgi:hypothetical protein